MKTLDRKLLRDLRLMWSQALTIALVVASGIGGFVTSLSAVDSLAGETGVLLAPSIAMPAVSLEEVSNAFGSTESVKPADGVTLAAFTVSGWPAPSLSYASMPGGAIIRCVATFEV